MARTNSEKPKSSWQEAWGIMLLALCVLVALSLASYRAEDIGVIQSPPSSPPHNLIGPLGAWFSFLAFMGLGFGGYLLPVAIAVLGFMFIFRRESFRASPKVAWMLCILLAVICLFELRPGAFESARARLNLGSPGGIVGHLVGYQLLVKYLGGVGTAILSLALLSTGLIFLFDVRPFELTRRLAALSISAYKQAAEKIGKELDRRQEIEKEEKELARKRSRLEQALKRTLEPPVREEPAPVARTPAAEAAPEPAPEKLSAKEQVTRILKKAMGAETAEGAPEARAPAIRKPAPEPAAEVPYTSPAQPAYELPPIQLLHVRTGGGDDTIDADMRAGGQVLEETLTDFGIEARVTHVETGPVVTRYEVLPAPGVRVERIAGLSNNIALAMKAETVRVQAPVPGKGVVGIEVPNSRTAKVYLREIIDSDAWRKPGNALPLALGKDVGGREIVPDLSEMPHLLIAGATGSGKTVCMNSILAGLLMSRTPVEMKLILVDPKIVEFSQYNDLPHLAVPVITDAKKVGLGLRWAIEEMEKRYKLFAHVGVRNIRSYNTRPIAKQVDLFGEDEDPGEKRSVPDRLPYIVIIVDELADLMLVAQAEIENYIARLAQLSRAVGIHMILATQRPSVNVITGTIKANFPARIAFKVAQKVDSRTILDTNGADLLLGKGDMLFLQPGSHKPVRAQGTLTTDEEIASIVQFIKQRGEPDYEVALKSKMDNKLVDIPEGEDDDLLDTAVEIIRQTRRASTSSLQRRLRIGYTRAARLMDLLEQRGVVGPPRGSDPREILIDLDGEIPQNAGEPGED